MFWEWQPYSCSVGERKLMKQFVVKNYIPFGCVGAALEYLCRCGKSLR